MTEALFTEAQCMETQAVMDRMQKYSYLIAATQRRIAEMTLELQGYGIEYSAARDELKQRQVIDR